MSTHRILDLQIPSGLVTRYHQQVGAESQNTATHSWGVACLLSHVTEDFKELNHPRLNVLRLVQAALFHDSAELLVGDISHVTKQHSPSIRGEAHMLESHCAKVMGINQFIEGLSELEQILLSWADMMEAVLWARHLFMEYQSVRYFHVYTQGWRHLCKGPIMMNTGIYSGTDSGRDIGWDLMEEVMEYGKEAKLLTVLLPEPEDLWLSVRGDCVIPESPFNLL